MKNIVLAFSFVLSAQLQAQYYYNDIIGTMDLTRLMKTYTANKVRSVSATGFDQNNVRATDFAEVQEVKENGTLLRISNRTANSLTVVYNRFDNQGRLSSVTDSSNAQYSVTNYQYDAAGRVVRVQNNVKDSANDFNQTETHDWIYNADGKPTKMWRIIAGTNNPKADSLEIRFVPDDKGNVGDEKTFRKGVETAVLYYYYDDIGRLTDIVRFNNKLKRLIPDVLFEYDDNNRVIQKITTTASLTVGYFIWRYLFDAKGLKTKEALFNNDKQLTGKIEYNYTFGQ
jgi:YD repeat-containing protein